MPKRILEGKVVSAKSNKTVTVLVERRTMHPLYKKYVKQSKKYAAHDEANLFLSGDVVRIQECAPISKSKTWTVVTPAPEGRAPRYTQPVAKPAPAPKVKAVKPAATPKTTVAKKPATKKTEA